MYFIREPFFKSSVKYTHHDILDVPHMLEIKDGETTGANSGKDAVSALITKWFLDRLVTIATEPSYHSYRLHQRHF